MDKFIRSALLGIAIALIAYSGFLAGLQAYNYVQAALSNNKVRMLAGNGGKDSLLQAIGIRSAGDGQTPASIAAAQKRIIDFETLQKNNPEIVAWLFIPNTRIDYPIAHTDNNEFYLHHDFFGRYSFSGCLFLDKEDKPDFTNPDSAVYGHSMANGSMFGTLEYFRRPAFRDSHQIAFVYLPDKTLKYQFVAGELIPPNGKRLKNTFDFTTLSLYTCAYDQVGDHYMARFKLLSSTPPGKPAATTPQTQ
ncbi:MAG: class B sortase [Actinomycetia bacterium]|nr:class B sortase [Actinomycetes bacterium]